MCRSFPLLLVAILFISESGRCQQSMNYIFRHLKQADGLLYNQVYSVAQDGRGFMWIATQNGLQRYDGLRLVHYPDIMSNPADDMSFGAELSVDTASNTLWMIRNSTLQKLDLRHNRFTIYDSNSVFHSPAFRFDTCLAFDNTQWQFNPAAIIQRDPRQHLSIPWGYNILQREEHRSAFFMQDTKNNYWLCAGGRLINYDYRKGQVRSDSFNPENHPLLRPGLFGVNDKAARYVMIDSKNNIWVTTWGDVFYMYDVVSKRLLRWNLSSLKSVRQARSGPAAALLINSVMEDNHHQVWIATENAGLLQYNPAAEDFDYCLRQQGVESGLHYNYKITNLFQDREDNIWVSTDMGINIFNPYHSYFRVVRHAGNQAASIPENEINCVLQGSSGNLFVGTWGGGISVYDSIFQFKKNIFFKGDEENNFTWSFIQPEKKTLWIGCQRGRLQWLNLATMEVTALRPPEAESATIRAMCLDTTGNVWLGLHNGKIIGWDRKTRTFLPYRGTAGKEPAVLDMKIDRFQRCWVSTQNGFRRFDLRSRTFTHTWLPDRKDPAAISGKTCHGIEIYNDTTLLVGTSYGGVNVLHTNSGKFTHLFVGNEFTSNTVYAIRKDGKGSIWCSTDYGLCKFPAGAVTAVPYVIQAGVLNASFIANNFYVLHSGEWMSYSANEVVRFLPADLEGDTGRKTNIEITGFKVFDRVVPTDSVMLGNRTFRLSYKENFITIEFASLYFMTPGQINYAYRLIGVDEDWVNAGTKLFANYTDLQPGNYRFEVKAETGEGKAVPASFVLVIAPPFWKSAWFRLLCMVAVVAIVYTVTKMRFATIRQAAKTKMLLNQQMAELEMKALRSQMNPHFIFNCINSIDAMIQSNDKYHATVYLNKFAKLIRNILDSSNQNMIPLGRDLETLQLYIDLEKFRNDNRFTGEIVAEAGLLTDDFKVPPLIIQPFVENAILHGIRYREDAAGRLLVSVEKQGDYLKYIIEDNGVGRNAVQAKPPQEKKSYGISLSSDRVQLFNKEDRPSVFITDLVKEGKAAGTRVEVWLKVQ